ncbi:hypothetical protein SK128_006581, partial [Halocaridina rubra]
MNSFILLVGVTLLWSSCGINANIYAKEDPESDLLFTGAEAVADILEEEVSPRCAIVVFTDGPSTTHSLFKNSSSPFGQRSVTVLQMPQEFTSDNETWLPALHLAENTHELRSFFCIAMVVCSLNTEFLEAYAEWANLTRIMPWEIKTIILTHLENSEVNEIMSNHWTFSMMNIMLVNVQSSSPVRCDIFAYFYYHRSTKSVLQRIVSWKKGSGFFAFTEYSFFPEKYENCHGGIFNTITFIFPPYMMYVEKKAPNGTMVPTLAGREIYVWEAIAKAMNFSLVIHVRDPTIPSVFWIPIDERTAFARSMKLPFLPHMMSRYDYSVFIEDTMVAFTMKKPSLKPRWQSLYYPLTELVWLSTLIALFVVPAVMLILSTVGGNTHITRNTVFEDAYRILLCQSVSDQRIPATSSARVLVVTWLIFTFIIGSAYRGNLIGFLTIPKYPKRPETLAEMIASGAGTLFPNLLKLFLVYFTASNSTLSRTLVSRSSVIPTFGEGVKILMKYENTSVMYERFVAELIIVENYTAIDGTTPLYVAKGMVLPGWEGYPAMPDSPFTHNVNKVILAIHA